jgi:hypothetical protein
MNKNALYAILVLAMTGCVSRYESLPHPKTVVYWSSQTNGQFRTDVLMFDLRKEK